MAGSTSWSAAAAGDESLTDEAGTATSCSTASADSDHGQLIVVDVV